MSIKSEISRLTNNISNSLDVLAEQGVNIPATANSDNLPELIRETGNKVNVSDIVDNLTTADATKPLSANQGVVIAEAINAAKQECLDEVETLEDSILNENGIIKQDALPVGYPYVTTGTVLSETIFAIDNVGDTFPIIDNFNIAAGHSYKVTWNGTIYDCIAQETDIEGVSCIGIGDVGVLNGQEPSGLPFIVIKFDESTAEYLGFNGGLMILDGSTAGVISIDGSIVQKIDKAFLPDINTLKNLMDGLAPASIRATGAAVEDDDYTIGIHASAFGHGTKASGGSSHAEGYETVASGYASHAEGVSTTAAEEGSHAEGAGTTASGYYSHAEGSDTIASGDTSHAEGANTVASGWISHAEGINTIASGRIQHVQGQYNIVDASNKYAHIVGNGIHGSPSNAHTLDWDGVAWFAGDVKVGGTGQDDENAKTLATTDYVDTKIGEIDFSIPLDEHSMDTTAHADIRRKIDAINDIIGTDDSILGTWVFNDEISADGLARNTNYEFDFTCEGLHFEGGGMDLGTVAAGMRAVSAGPGIPILEYYVYYYNGDTNSISAYTFPSNYSPAGWNGDNYKTIEILEAPTDETFITWLKNNATKQSGTILERLNNLDAALDSKVSTFTVETDPMTTMRDIITTIEREGGDITALNVVNLTGYLSTTLEIRFSHAGGSRYNISCALPLEAAVIGKNNFDVDTTIIRDYLSSAISFEEAVSKQIPVSHYSLLYLRDNSELTPGMFYRITDYQCTTTQENTRAMSNQFDIIVQALSSNTLSENAKADYHWEGDTPDGYFAKLEGGFRLDPLFDITEDETGTSDGDPYRTEDVFIAYDYAENPDGDIVPILYKTNIDQYPDEPDYGDVFYYVGTYELDGTIYDRWRKIDQESGDAEYTWDGTVKKYVLTDVVIDNGVFIDSIVNSEGTVKYLANLPAWELKYSLDNDTTRFAWADEANGKGVVYWMKDEHNNECPYDFKNVQFRRMVSLENGYPEYDPENGEDTWVYTFCGNSFHIDNDEWSELKDGSLESPYGHQSDVYTSTFNNNKIGEYIMLYDTENEDNTKCGKLYLNNNVFFGYWYEVASSSEEAAIYYASCCSNNTFGNNCYSNTFGNECYYIIFGNDCYSNTVGNSCYDNTFGNSCGFNTFGDSCRSNTFGNYCDSNTFGYGCNSNTFGGYCSYNTFGGDCESNTFGISCYSNTFGIYCYSNTFGISCYSNNFGSYCDNITLGNECHNISSEDKDGNPISYMSNIYYANKCAFIQLMDSGGIGDDSNYVQNITVSAGIGGTSDYLILQVSRNAPPVVYEAAGTTHIILD